MAQNLNNNGVIAGRLAADPRILTNSDGSRKIFATVYADNNWKGKDGKRGSERIGVEAFVNKKFTTNGAFDHMVKGDEVAFGYHLEMDEYTKNGETVYQLKVVVDTVDLRSTKAESEKRRAEQAAREAIAANQAGSAATEQDQPAAPAPATEEDSPFGA